jgi:hypothetical protein
MATPSSKSEQIEARIRAQVEAELAREEKLAKERAEQNARYGRQNAARAKARLPFLPALEAAKAKATVVWLVEEWDCEGRSSRPVAFFSDEAEARKIADSTGPMGGHSEPREHLMFATAKDYAAFSRAKYDAESAGQAASEATR